MKYGKNLSSCPLSLRADSCLRQGHHRDRSSSTPRAVQWFVLELNLIQESLPITLPAPQETHAGK